MGKEVKVEIKNSTGAVGSFFNSFGKGAGLCVGVCVGIVAITFIIFFVFALLSTPGKLNESNSTTDYDYQNSIVGTTSVVNTVSAEQEYINKYLELSNVISGMGYGKYDVPGYSTPKQSISGTIKNKGSESLDKVEITVYFLDNKGNAIGEESYLPIFVSSYSLSSDEPLKPNYTKDFGYIVDNVAPSDWDKNIRIAITEIAFTK